MKQSLIALVILSLGLISDCSNAPTPKPGPALAQQELFEKYQVGAEDFENFKNTITPSHSPASVLTPVPVGSPVPRKKKVAKVEDPKLAVTETEGKGTIMPARYPADYPENYIHYDEQAKKYWENYRPNVRQNELHVFRVSFMGVKAAELYLRSHEVTMLDGKEHFHFSGQVKSSNYYKFIYQIDDTIHSYVAKNEFLPSKYTLVQDETGKKISDLQLFDQSKMKTFYWYKKIKTKNNEEKRDEQVTFIPYFTQDFFSVFQFLRGMDLQKGANYSLPIINRAKVRLLTAKVLHQESLQVLGRKIASWKVEAETMLPDVMEDKDVWTIWYSTDETKKILKISAKIKIGSVNGELEKYEPGELIRLQ